MYFHVGDGGKRGSWRIEYSAKKLLQASQDRISYHSTRLLFWEKERDQAETKLKSEGITLRSFEITGGSRTEAQLDDGLAKRVGECQSSIQRHANEINTFLAYQAFFTAQPEKNFELTVDDVLYFNLFGADTEE